MTTCERCGEVNPAEIHTCTPKSEEGCAECGKKSSDGWALYCVKCSEREWHGLTEDDAISLLPVVDYEYEVDIEIILEFAKNIEAKLKQKNA